MRNVWTWGVEGCMQVMENLKGCISNEGCLLGTRRGRTKRRLI